MAQTSLLETSTQDEPVKTKRPVSARKSMFQWWADSLDQPVDIAPIVFFRVFFGAIMAYHIYAMKRDFWIEFFYIQPSFHFTYPGFSWVTAWPGEGMYYHFYLMGLAAVGISLGFLYRISALLFFLGYTHLFLIEKALYQNHCYLICLISGSMVLIPAHKAFSIDNLLKRTLGIGQTEATTLPLWTLRLLQFQLAIPYFYGGLAKLNSDWLQAQPMKLWLARLTEIPMIGAWLAEPWMPWFVSYAGLIFDLLIVPALLFRRTRLLGYGLALSFHLTNSVLWEIGIFPWFMIGATLLFFPPEQFRRSLPFLTRKNSTPSINTTPTRSQIRSQTQSPRWIPAVLLLYVSWQLLLPFRHFLYPGNVSWNEEGHHFAWHMMLREKDVGIRFYAYDRTTKQWGLIRVEEFLNSRQLSRMGKDPDMVLEFVHHVRDHYREQGNRELEIYVLNIASLNGRKPQLLMDPYRNYSTVERRWTPQPWIKPLQEPLLSEGWKAPLTEWEHILDLDIPDFMRLSRSQLDQDSATETP